MAVIACLVMAGLRVLSSVAFLATGSSHKPVAGNATGPMNADYQVRENDAYSIGVQAYIYGLARSLWKGLSSYSPRRRGQATRR
jgi:hypothetical protein